MRSAFTTVLEGLARINVIRRFSAQTASDQGKVEAYLQRELTKVRESFRELPDRSQHLDESALDRVLYPIVALADVCAGDVVMVEETTTDAPATAEPKRAPRPPIRQPPPPPAAASAQAPRVSTPPGPPPIKPPTSTPDSPFIPAQKKGAFEWASVLELQEYGTNIAGLRVPANIEAILRDEPPMLGRIMQGQRYDQPARPIHERDEKVEAYAYWFVLRLGFMGGDQAEGLARRLRRRFADYKHTPSLPPPPPSEKASKAARESMLLQIAAPLFVVTAGLLCMYLLHYEQQRATQAFDAIVHPTESR